MAGGRSIPRVRRPASPPLKSDFSLGVPFGYQPELTTSPRVGAMVHIFHPELAPEFERLLHHLGEDASIVITTDTADKQRSIVEVFADWPPALLDVRVVENRGRDVWAKITTLRDRFTEFDLILFLHSKRTPHSPDGVGWRDTLMSGLAGSADVVNSILAIFEAEPHTGLIFCQHHEPIRRFVDWGSNFRKARKIARTWGLRLNRSGEIDFPSGSMFWARPAALQPLLGLGLNAADFPPEEAQRDGTIAHAIERLFALSAEVAGFRWFKVAAPGHYHYRETIVTPWSDAELRAFLARHEPTLMKTMVRSAR